AMQRARWNARENAEPNEVPATTRVLAVASGKGGVGKSSVTVNLAAALAARGLTVGVLDADIWGFNVPRMLGVEGRLSGADAQIPIEPEVSAGGDTGRPVALAHPDSPAGRQFHALAAKVVDDLLPPIEMAGCTARILDLANELAAK